MAAVEPMDELKECLRASVEMLLDKLNDRLHEDMDGSPKRQSIAFHFWLMQIPSSILEEKN